MAFVEIIVKVNGDSASDALEALADIGFAALQGVDAQAELAVQPDELPDAEPEEHCTCNQFENAGCTSCPPDPYDYEVGGYYPVFLDEKSARYEIAEYAGDGQFLLTGVREPVDVENLAGIGPQVVL